MIIDNIVAFFQSKNYKPYFAVVGDEEYNSILLKLNHMDVDFIRLSDHCLDDDKLPDLDNLKEHLLTADVDCKSNNVVVLGVGEWLSLLGSKRAFDVLNSLKDSKVGTAHVVFLLKCVKKEIEMLAKNDLRFDERRFCVSNNCGFSLKLIFASKEIGISNIDGIRGLLHCLENGVNGELTVNTSFVFPDSNINIRIVNDHYEALNRIITNFNINKECGNDENWEFLYKEIKEIGSLENIFKKYNLAYDEQEFYKSLYGNSNVHWLYYVYLLKNGSLLENKYLRYCLSFLDTFDDFKRKFLNYIIDVSYKSQGFNELYNDRKRLIKFFPDSEVALFVSNNRINPTEEIYKLTDCHIVEKEEIISYIAQNGMPSCLRDVYPDLYYYSKKYEFISDKPNKYYEFLTAYFYEYKNCKLKNTVSPKIVEMVEKEAVDRNFNRLETRDILVNSYDKNGSFLCWIDALGSEYLSYIVEKAREYGLMISVNYGRAELPTITSINKGFYANWKHNKKKIETLDDYKHEDKGGFYYGDDNKYSIHLASELEVIDSVLRDAATSLSLGKYSNYIIASDHGASRLAVLYNKNEKYDTDTQGEHSGRCCKAFEGYDLDFATVENGYIVLADYGRFKGSRAANVEVHGGATIEEVVVPVISLSLKDKTIKVLLVENNVKVDYKTPATILIFVNKSVSSLTLRYGGKEYHSIQVDDTHYKFTIDEIRKAGLFHLDIFNDGSLLSRIDLTTKGKSASINDDFDI
ncbi:BREX-4 system phosphatase PglZ [Anaeroplasma bactoclasticum]|jgi:hypothetical protein|nr:BREX-4 system phosphatase PglZ [Anaeroplasma bactoclasticum]